MMMNQNIHVKKNLLYVSLCFMLCVYSNPSISTIDQSCRVSDYSCVYHGNVQAIYSPKTIKQLRDIVMHADKPIAIAGTKYSMGAHTWLNNGIVISMQNLSAITAFDPEEKMITVQAGACWRQIQNFLHPHDLSIKVMQSYNDFSVGGSLSVNCHGRDPQGQLITSVERVTVMIFDGSLVRASRTENKDLFTAVIGGYGTCGIIVDATLRLEDNYKIERIMKTVSIHEFTQFYEKNIAHDQNVALFNANIYGPQLDQIMNFIWYKTDKKLTCPDLAMHQKKNLLKVSHVIAPLLEYSVSEFSLAQKIRFLLDDAIIKNTEHVVWRSYEMSHQVKELASNSDTTAKILQEYFIPVAQFSSFVALMRQIFIEHHVKVLNVSIRYVPGNNESILTYAPQESFAFVCYIALNNNEKSIDQAQVWTQKLIAAAIECQGIHYLPYHTFASQAQFLQCYPRYLEFIKIKEKYDPVYRFQNQAGLQYYEFVE